MDKGLETLGALTILRTYSKNGEDWNGICDRYLSFMRERYPSMVKKISSYGKALKMKLCVPSMRAMQFSDVLGLENLRAYNCAFLAPQEIKDFGDLVYLLSCGCGVGISVEKRYADKLKGIINTAKRWPELIVIPDTKEGWADSFIQLLSNPYTTFNYTQVRPKGAKISTGGTASGPEPLMEGHEKVREILLNNKVLKPIHIADICCLIAQSVVSGGVRRSALIILFDNNDDEMLNFKGEDWWSLHPHRGKANISACAEKGSKDVESVINVALNSIWGEPGVVLSNKDNKDSIDNTGINPCAEISLRNRGLCNLTEVICSNCKDKEDFIWACQASAFFGTLQAGLTEFHYVNKEWSDNAIEDALIGVSLTGQAMAKNLMKPDILKEGALEVNCINEKTAKEISINIAKRTTCVKPSGTTSASMGSTSGIHAAYAPLIIRRVRVTKASPLGLKLVELYGISTYKSSGEGTKNSIIESPIKNCFKKIFNYTLSFLKGSNTLEIKPNVDKYSFLVYEAMGDKDIVMQIPCKLGDSIFRAEESPVDLLNRMKNIYQNWVLVGHREGNETNNVSITVEYKPEDKESLKEWMLNNQGSYRGISLLPYNGGNYPLAPFEEVNEEEFKKFSNRFPKIDWSSLGIKADIQGTSSCSGGSCEVT